MEIGAVSWKIEKVVSKGDYLYAVVKDHPNRTKNNYVLLHRVIVENYLGRLLNSVVDSLREKYNCMGKQLTWRKLYRGIS